MLRVYRSAYQGLLEHGVNLIDTSEVASPRMSTNIPDGALGVTAVYISRCFGAPAWSIQRVAGRCVSYWPSLACTGVWLRQERGAHSRFSTRPGGGVHCHEVCAPALALLQEQCGEGPAGVPSLSCVHWVHSVQLCSACAQLQLRCSGHAWKQVPRWLCFPRQPSMRGCS